MLIETVTYYKPYLYYLGGFDEDRERWVLSNVSLGEYNESISLIYGYLECSLLNVVNCQAPWTLLWNNSVRYPDTLLHIDAGKLNIFTLRHDVSLKQA